MGKVDPLLVDTETARHMLGIGKTNLFRLLKDKKLKRVKLGNKTLVTVASVRDLTAELVAASEGQEAA